MVRYVSRLRCSCGEELDLNSGSMNFVSGETAQFCRDHEGDGHVLSIPVKGREDISFSALRSYEKRDRA